MDAPVSGGSEGAERGTLAIMVGGDPADVERAKPFMKAYGTSITHVGPVGAGQMVKQVNQVLVVVNGLAVSEALLLAKAGGLDLDATIEAVKGGGAGSWMLANRGPQIVDRDWRPGFTIDLQQKDLRLVLESADELAVPLPATSLVFQMYRALQRRLLQLLPYVPLWYEDQYAASSERIRGYTLAADGAYDALVDTVIVH